jgi:hypothetical protein
MTRQAVIIESNILHLLEEEVWVAHATLKVEGVPVLTMNTGSVFTFHSGLRAWLNVTKAADRSISAIEVGGGGVRVVVLLPVPACPRG